jgi:glucose-1-phosphate thymidylyltransferase
MKGIVLAGGTGSRLWPTTKAVNKHLLPVYDKPMILYPISTLLLCGIKDICVIIREQDYDLFKELIGDGSNWGIKISFLFQNKPEGIAQAFQIAEEFIGDEEVILILGDNIFYGNGFIDKLRQGIRNLLEGHSSVFLHYVSDPKRFGVATITKDNEILEIIEKPQNPKSNYAVTGLYFYTNDIITVSKNIVPSARGELEITDVNNYYLSTKKLKAILLGRGFAWLDTGNYDSLMEASSFVSTIEKIQGYKISIPEEIVFMLGYISKSELSKIIENFGNSGYGKYLRRRFFHEEL